MKHRFVLLAAVGGILSLQANPGIAMGADRNGVGARHVTPGSSIPKSTRAALKKASQTSDFLVFLRNADADGLKGLLVKFKASPDIEIAIHSSPIVGQTTDFVNGPCFQYGWYYTHSGLPLPNGSDHITYGCISWGGSGSGQFNGGIWYPD
ncbi:MAG: hypothetical protein WDN04_12495 [Rhodospirillales bacterium]